MDRIDKLVEHRSGPKKSRPRLKPFAAIPEINYNPWALCREYEGTIPVTYGNIQVLARRLLGNVSQEIAEFYIKGRRWKRYQDGRAFRAEIRILEDGTIAGGAIQISDSAGRNIRIHDVKGLFHQNFPTTRTLYGTDDLAAIMERTRESLLGLGIKPDGGAWERGSSITSYLWREQGMDLYTGTPAVSAPRREPGNLQGYSVFGCTTDPVYIFDIRSAYLSELAKFEAFRPFAMRVWNARQSLAKAHDPTAQLFKQIATIIPGKFTSELPNNRFYRRPLGLYIRKQTNDRLRAAMALARDSGEVYRWCVDGFIASRDISHRLDIGDDLGQWKPVEIQPNLTIARTNVWWAGNAFKTNGYKIRRQDFLNNPLEVRTSRNVFDWTTFKEREEPIIITQNHYEEHCRACRSGRSNLHDRIMDGVVLIREEDYT